MISKIRTCLVAILAAATVVTSVPVYATDTKVDTNIETVENQPSDSEQIEENQVQNAIEQHLNYLYIESPYVETPATQRIVVSWGDGTENIEEIDLSVEHNGDTQTWTSVKSEDGVFLYEKAYADGEDGIYTITKLTVKTAEMETSYLLSDLGMEAKFGVNETYEGMSELQPIEGQPDAEAATDEEQYDVAVMSIDEDGNVMEESSIEDALEKAEVEEYDSDEDIQTYAEDNARAVDDSRAVNKNVVVALDPGHDSTHTGAGANGVREEVLTLKIAQYCKEELEKYANVSVYMTRTTAACPYPSNKNSGGDISDRVYAAAKAGASIFVSFHLNSSTSTSAKGAEVIVPNDSWKPEVAQQGKELANDIMDELTAIGLQKRSIYSKDTTLADEKYPDGSKSDYFSVQIAAKENNIPGIIVEHAFVTNTGDVNTYLNNEAGLKKLGVADATGIAKYLGVSKEKGTWVEDSNGWKYKEGGKYVTNSWKDIDGKRYYFDANGYRVTGWQTIGGKKYFFMPEGYMMTGWISFGSTRYYLMPDGHMLTGWCSFGSTKYYLASDGKMVRGWQTIDGKRYYFNDDGVMQTGWQTINGKKYFFMPEGYMMTGWISFGSTRYYLDKNGVMQTGWQTIDGKRYFFMPEGYMMRGWISFGQTRYHLDANGVMQTGWQTISEKRYFFMPEGYMMRGWISFGQTKYYLSTDGVMQTGWQTIDGKRYFFMPEGYMMRGWISFGKTRYYLDSNGVMVTGKQVIDGTTYTFASDGKLIVESKRGWKTVNGKKYYYNENGVAVTGWQTIDGKKYFFMPEGYMMTGWISFGSTKYYLGTDGVMRTGWQTINGKKYFFMPEGYMMTGWISFGQTRYYLMPDGHMLTGWCSFGSTKYYLASDGKMVRGWQTISGKKYYFNTDGIMQTGWQTIDGKKYFFMPEGYMMTGWISFGKTRYYLDANGVMQTGWQFISNTWYYFRTNGTLDDSCTTDQLMAISGKTTVTASQMEKYFKAKGATYPAYYAETDAPTLEKFCQIYVEEANAEGINGAIAFTQAMKETAWLKFGGDVKIEQNNFAGLGTTGGGVAGASFTTVREGIRAQIQHLKAYGSKDALKNECVDPRFSLVTRGSAPYVEWLGQKENPNGYGWATSEGYGIDIEKMVKNLQTY